MTTTEVTAPSPAELLSRWDDQQAAYIADRDGRFAAVANVIGLVVGERPRVLDLACGPGSFTAAILNRFPEATVTAVDVDPLLLAIAADTVGAHPGATVAPADLTDPTWTTAFDLGGFDAVISSTALHWLYPGDLAELYRQLGAQLPAGAIFLNADHLFFDRHLSPTLANISQRDDQAVQDAAFAAGADTWEAWWEAAESRPDYAGPAAARKALWADRPAGAPKVTLGFHLEALRSAGFAETGTVWQRLDDYVVFGRKPTTTATPERRNSTLSES